MDPSRRAFESVGGVDRHDTSELREGEQYLFDTYLSSGHVLDLGCGTGRTTAYLARGRDVVGIDYAEAMIARARGHHPTLDFRVMDARALDFPDASFDGAFFSFNGIDYLYPLAERLAALGEIHRVVKPGGIFAYTSHREAMPRPDNPKRILGHLYRLLHGYRSPYFTHFTGYGFVITCHLPPLVQQLHLQDAGFELIETRPVKNTEMLYIARRL